MKKDSGISRNVGKGRPRSSAEGPTLGHVNRMAVGAPNAEPAEGRRRRRISDAERLQKERHQQWTHAVMVRWTLMFGLLALVVISLFAMFWLMPYLERRKQPPPDTTRIIVSPVNEEGSEVPKEERTIDLAKKALGVESEEEVKELIESHPVSSGEVLEFFRKLPEEDGEVVKFDWLPRLDTDREDVSGVVVTFRKGGERRNRLALFAPDETGVWKMDFPAFARLSTPSWKDLMTGAANSAVVRVYVAEDQYYNGPFREQDGWRCYGIASPDVPDLLYGYCLVDGPQDKALNDLLVGRKAARATLGIERAKDADRRQFRIKRVLAQDWLVGDKAPDDTAK